jgi:hypothetical protein
VDESRRNDDELPIVEHTGLSRLKIQAQRSSEHKSDLLVRMAMPIHNVPLLHDELSER